MGKKRIIKAHTDKAGSSVGVEHLSIQNNLTVNGSLNITPTNLTDSDATKLGYKSYASGDGSGLVITGSGLTLTYSELIPYQMQNGDWRIRFNIRGSWGASTDYTITVSGVNFSGGFQAGAFGNLTAASDSYCVTQNGGQIRYLSGASQSAGCYSGDVQVNEKPTWAF
jgi:hypothetical protein